MEPLSTPADLRRRRRALAHAAHVAGADPLPARAVAAAGVELGTPADLPPGSRRLGPVEAGDQGISPSERPHAEQAIERLFEAGGVDMIALYDQQANTYELRSRTGFVRWERWSTPSGELRYRVVAQQGENPVPSIDGTILRTLEEEAAAAGGVGKPVPKDRNSYPDILGRLTQLFDHARAPEFVYIPTPGGDPNHPGAGSHGIPDMVQSRAPMVIAGPGIRPGAVVDTAMRHEDLAPTLAEMLGVKPVIGTNASGVPRPQLLKWQDGHSLAASLVDGRVGAHPYGIAQRALVFTVDGMSQTAMLDEVKRGNLPNFARLMARGTMLRNGTLAQYPTVTWANHNTLVTGASPGHNGLVNNSWWDRTTQTERLITDGGFRNSLRTGELMSPQVETLYEAVERSFPNVTTMAINQPSGRGADVSVLDLTGLPKLLANIARIGVSFLKGGALMNTAMNGDKDWRSTAIQDRAGTAIAEAFWSKADAPKVGVIEFTLVDNQGHIKGPHHPDARLALQQVDRQVGAILDTLERRGIAGSTAIVLTADHGMEHQDTDPAKLGGWFEALDRAAADGAKTKESTRFVYVRSVRWSTDGAVPAVGTRGPLTIRVANDDVDASGGRPPVGGAQVTVRDAAGHVWTGVTQPDGSVHLPIAPTAGPLTVTIEHADFSSETGTIPVPGQ